MSEASLRAGVRPSARLKRRGVECDWENGRTRARVGADCDLSCETGLVADGNPPAAPVEGSPQMANGDGVRVSRRYAPSGRRHRLRGLAQETEALPEGLRMTGLEDRLRKVVGVTDIVVELGAEGLEGIRVRLSEGAEESEVLEEIRRILVAYGLKSSGRRGRGTQAIPPLELGIEMPLLDEEAPDDGSSRESESGAVSGSLPKATIRPIEGRLVARLEDGYRTVEASAEATPLGATEAMIRVTAEWRGARIPHRIAVDRLDIDGTDVVVLVARRDNDVVSASSVVDPDLAAALAEAAFSIMDRLES